MPETSKIGWTADGRLVGCYLYMLLCQERDTLFIKIGVTINPEKRLLQLVNNCPLKAVRFAVVRVWSKKMALFLERSLHAAFAKHRQTGEWFRFTYEDKQEFNAKVRKLLDDYKRPNWPFEIEQMPVQPLIRLKRERQRWYFVGLRRKGRAYADFKKHLTNSLN